MPTNVIMPALGLAQDFGKVLRWVKAEGETVTKGEPLIEIETDKTTVEIEAPASGVLAHVTATAGDEVPVGQVIAVILAHGEPSPQILQGQSVPPLATDRALLTGEAPSVPSGLSTGLGTASRQASASPKARRLAQELGVDLSVVQGTGPGGAVIEDDILRAKASTRPPVPQQMPSESTIWRLMAERTTRSWTTAPHFYLFREANASRLLDWRAETQERHEAKITLTDLIIKLVAVELRSHPGLNASWSEGRVTPHPEINIGLAVAVEDGLVVPVIKRADTLSITQIAARRKEIVERARAARLQPDDIQGSTFTISNLGMYDIDAFIAVINPVQAAVLAVGRVADRVVVVNRLPAVQPVFVLCLSCDHRVVDGARAARFLADLAALIEEPLTPKD